MGNGQCHFNGTPIIMENKHNQMRIVRKRTCLIQDDIAYLMQCSDHAVVSRWEQGHTIPPLQLIILYHILFNIPVDSLFRMQKTELSRFIAGRIRSRVSHLRGRHLGERGERRIAFLEQALTRVEPKLSLV